MWDEIIKPTTEYARKLDINFRLSITTNGMLLDEEKLKFMKENNIGLLLSMDGDQPTQDINRPTHNNKSSFDVLVKKIPTILNYYPNVTFRGTISNETVQYTFENMKFAIDNGFNNMFFIPNVFAEWTDSQVKTLRQQLKMLSNYYIDTANKGSLLNLNNLNDKFKEILLINDALDRNTPKSDYKCGIGMGGSCCITIDGRIIGCQHMSTYCDDTFDIGDVFNGVDMDRRINLVSKFNVQKIEGFNCNTCKLKPICNGGCLANNYLINGNLHIMPRMMCIWNQMLLDEAIHIMDALGESKNQIFKEFFLRGGSKWIG